MLVRVKIVMMSHLSDITEYRTHPITNNHKINFVKYLILTYPNTDVEIDADEVYKEYQIKHSNLIK